VIQKTAIVTGAARGIGAGAAIRLASDGMAVAVLDLNEADCMRTVKEIENAGGRALAVGADVSKTDQVNAAVERVAAELGEPTVLVNNAGITRDALLFKMTDEDWDAVINVNLRGAFLMTRAVQKYMTEQKWGRIVNISSSSALGNRGQANYSATKAGLADVGADGQGAPAGVLDLLDRGLAVGLGQVQHRHGHPVGGQPDGRPRADAAGCSGHDRDSP